MTLGKKTFDLFDVSLKVSNGLKLELTFSLRPWYYLYMF